MYREEVLRVDRAHLVDRVADDVEYPAQYLAADRHRDRVAGVRGLHAPHEAVRARHGDGAHPGLAQVHRNLKGKVEGRRARGRIRLLLDKAGVVDLRQISGGELDIDDRADNLDYSSLVH